MATASAVLKHKSKGRRILLDSLHVDGILAHQDALEDEGFTDNADISKAQDLARACVQKNFKGC